MKKKRRTTDAVEILDRLFFEGHPERYVELERCRIEDEIARKIYSLRTAARLTQGQLAKRVGVPASEIDDLEAADYDGDYLTMLSRIAKALGKRVEIRAVPDRRRATA